jgi:hypothetical protein
MDDILVLKTSDSPRKVKLIGDKITKEYLLIPTKTEKLLLNKLGEEGIKSKS